MERGGAGGGDDSPPDSPVVAAGSINSNHSLTAKLPLLLNQPPLASSAASASPRRTVPVIAVHVRPADAEPIPRLLPPATADDGVAVPVSALARRASIASRTASQASVHSMLHFATRWELIVFLNLMAWCVLTSVGSQVSFALLSQRMQGLNNVAFLLWSTTIGQLIVYGVAMLIWTEKGRKKFPTDARSWKWLCVLGVCNFAPNTLYQFADPYLDGSLQSIINVLQLPATYVMVALFLKDKPEFKRKGPACIVVVLGVLLAAVPPLFQSKADKSYTTPAGVVLYALGIIANSALYVIQQKLCRGDGGDDEMDVYVQLFWGNVVTLIPFMCVGFFLMLPALGSQSLAQVWTAQVQSVQCFAESTNPLPPNCLSGAWLVVAAQTVFYLLATWFQSLLTRDYSALFQCVVIAIVTPLTTFAFMIPAFGSEVLTWNIAVSLVMILIGVGMYFKAHQKPEPVVPASDKREPLIHSDD